MALRSLSGWAAIVWAVMLVACSGGQPSSQPGGPVTRYTAIGAKVRGLDPMDIGDTTSSAIASHFYECLYQYHYLKRPYQIIPCLAADMPAYSDDGLTLTIPIRQDVYFHNDACFPDGKGRQLVAEDFIYAWKRIAYIKNVSKNWWILEGRIAGLDAFREGTKDIQKSEMDYSQEVEGLRAINPSNLRIKLTRPWPAIEYALAHLPLAAVPREAVGHYGDELINHEVGTGPFILETWLRGSRIVMTRNPRFREERYPTEGEPGDEAQGLLADTGKRLPLIDRAEIRIILEDQPYWLTFMRGETDAAGIPKDSFDMAINENRDLTPQMAGKGIRLTKYPEPTTFWIGFNMEDEIVGNNLPLRQAMNLAVDVDRFIELFTNNRAMRARGPLPPTVPDYNPLLNCPYAKYDPEQAREKLAEARQHHRELHGTDLPKLTLIIPGTDVTSIQHGQFYARCFDQIGLDVDVDNMDWPSMQDRVKTKSAQMFSMGWIMDWPDAENMLLLWYGPNASPGANNMNYANPAFDQLYEKITVMRDSEARRALIRRMEQIVVDNLPCVFTTHRVSYYLQYEWCRNYKPHVFGYGLMKYYNIDADLRRRGIGR